MACSMTATDPALWREQRKAQIEENLAEMREANLRARYAKAPEERMEHQREWLRRYVRFAELTRM